MKAAFIVVVGLWSSAGMMWGNGGAYRYGTKSTGTLQPFQAEGVEQVAITEERLDIELERGHAKVKVRYLMENKADRRVRVRFGFPVELPQDPMLAWGISEKPASEQLLGENVKDYHVWADGQEVEATFRAEEGTREERAAFDERLEAIVGWMVSEITFAKGQERIVQIGYNSKYDQAGSHVSEDARNGPKVFRYRLSTGAVWEGPIRKGTITVTATGVIADEVEIFKPVGKFGREGKTWTWSFENLDPTLADDLEIRAEPASNFLGGYADRDNGISGYFEQGGIWSVGHRLYEAKASSVLAPQGELTYEADHIRERGWNEEYRAWSEGVEGDGIGEWLELTPERVLPLYALEIRPGYGKSEKLFAANNRPSRVEILLNGEHRFEARLEDRDEDQMIRVPGYTKPVQTVRITIMDVYRGTHYRDSCISCVQLYSRLEKKPEVRGAR